MAPYGNYKICKSLKEKVFDKLISVDKKNLKFVKNKTFYELLLQAFS